MPTPKGTPYNQRSDFTGRAPRFESWAFQGIRGGRSTPALREELRPAKVLPPAPAWMTKPLKPPRSPQSTRE